MGTMMYNYTMEGESNAETNANIVEFFATTQANKNGIEIRSTLRRSGQSAMELELILEGKEFGKLKDTLSQILRIGNNLGAKFENDEYQIYAGNLIKIHALHSLLWEFGAQINTTNSKERFVTGRTGHDKNLVKFTLSFN